MSTDETVEREAADWFAALRRGPITVEERHAYDAWREDPRHQVALNRMHEMWGELGSLREVPGGVAAMTGAPASPGRRWAIAAGLAAVAAAGGGLWHALDRPGLATGIGEQQTAELSDGSVVALNVMTRLTHDMAPHERRVTLDGGEAIFFVRKDKARPFVVDAGGYRVRAVGTAFNVRDRDRRIEVAVKEGVVEVIGGGIRTRVAAGQRLTLPVSGGGAPGRAALAMIDPRAVDEWRMRIVSYDDAPVAQVVADLNRFYERPLRVAAPELAARRVTIRLKLDERGDTLTRLAALLDAGVRTGEGADLLYPAATDARKNSAGGVG